MPPAHRRWEYRIVRFPHDEDGGLENPNGAGYDGWDAVGVVPRDLGESWVILKRELLGDESRAGLSGSGGRRIALAADRGRTVGGTTRAGVLRASLRVTACARFRR